MRITVLVAAFLFLFKLNAHAETCTGGECSGGGSTTSDGKFYDNVLKEGKFIPSESSATKKVFVRVNIKINKLGELIPEFGKALRKEADKPWYFVEEVKKLPEEITGLEIPYESVAVNDRKKILISSNWYLSTARTSYGGPVVTDEQRETLFVHEIVQGYRLSQQNEMISIDPENTTELTNKIMSRDFFSNDMEKDRQSLRAALYKYMKKTYYIPSDEKFVNSLKEGVIALCKDTVPADLTSDVFKSKLWKVFRNVKNEFLLSLKSKNENQLLDDQDQEFLALNFWTDKLVPVTGLNPGAYDENFSAKDYKKVCQKVGVKIDYADKDISSDKKSKVRAPISDAAASEEFKPKVQDVSAAP